MGKPRNDKDAAKDLANVDRDEDDHTQVQITYRFGPPPEEPESVYGVAQSRGSAGTRNRLAQARFSLRPSGFEPKASYQNAPPRVAVGASQLRQRHYPSVRWSDQTAR
jgi:hypothetical protein